MKRDRFFIFELWMRGFKLHVPTSIFTCEAHKTDKLVGYGARVHASYNMYIQDSEKKNDFSVFPDILFA